MAKCLTEKSTSYDCRLVAVSYKLWYESYRSSFFHLFVTYTGLVTWHYRNYLLVPNKASTHSLAAPTLTVHPPA
jgi:hypothetical protein